MSEKTKFSKIESEILCNIFDKTTSIEYCQTLMNNIDKLQHYEREKRIESSDYLNYLLEIIKKDIIETIKELKEYLSKTVKI